MTDELKPLKPGEAREFYQFLFDVQALGVSVGGADVCVSCITVDEIRRASVTELILRRFVNAGEVVWCSRCNSRMRESRCVLGAEN